MPIEKNSLDHEDAYDAEEFQWLIQWYDHFYLATDKDDPVSRIRKLKLKLRQTKDQLRDALRTNLELRRNNEKLAYDFYTQKLKLEEADKKTPLSGHRDQEQQITIEQLTHELQFVTTQKKQLTIERDGMTLQLEEQEARYKGMVDKLEQQIRSMACGHLFGDSCIRSYLKQSANCPMCRRAADIQDIRRTLIEMFR